MAARARAKETVESGKRRNEGREAPPMEGHYRDAQVHVYELRAV